MAQSVPSSKINFCFFCSCINLLLTAKGHLHESTQKKSHCPINARGQLSPLNQFQIFLLLFLIRTNIGPFAENLSKFTPANRNILTLKQNLCKGQFYCTPNILQPYWRTNDNMNSTTVIFLFLWVLILWSFVSLASSSLKKTASGLLFFFWAQ